jgi:hypothetical protein
MAITAAQLTVNVDADTRDAESGLKRISSSIAGIAKMPFNAIGSIVDFGSKVGIAAIGVEGLARATSGMARSLFGGNAAIENVTASLNAMTKDAGLSQQILADIRAEAAKTPFAFNEMAQATAGLIPAARMAGVELMDLVRDAEILAASNPAQGLEGAAFALREAVSGDFTSIIERFNLPRQYINQLKAEGVPALEAVRRAMLEMGYDSSLVANLANTATGRWSTLVDTFQVLRDTVTQPMFEVLSQSLAGLQRWLDANNEALQRFAAAFGRRLASALGVAARLIVRIGGAVVTFAQYLRWAVRDGDALNDFLSNLPAVFRPFARVIGEIAARFGIVRDAFITFRQSLQGRWVDDRRIMGIHRVVGLLGQTFGFLRNALQDVSRIGRVASGTFLGFPPAMRPVLQILGLLINAGAWFVRTLRDMLPVATSIARTVGRVLVTALGAAYTAIRRLADAFREGGFLGVLGELGSLIQDAFERVPWSQIGQALLSGLSTALGVLGGLAWDAGAWVIERIRAVDWGNAAREVLSLLGTALSTAGGLALDAASWFAGLVTGVNWGEVAADILGRIRDAFDTVTGLAWDAAVWLVGLIADVKWGEVATTILAKIRDGFLAVAGLTWDAAKWVAGMVREVKWGNLARRILINIRNGFTTVAGLTWDAAKWVADLVSKVEWAEVGQTILDKIVAAIKAITGLVWDVALWAKGQVESANWSSVASTVVEKLAAGIRTIKGIGEAVADAITSHDYTEAGKKVGADLNKGVGQVDVSGGPSIWERVIGGLGPIGTLIDNAVRNIQEGVRNIIDAGGNLTRAVGTFLQAFEGFGNAIARLMPTIRAVTGLLVFIGSAAVTGAMWLFGEALSAAAGGMNLLARALEYAAGPLGAFATLVDTTVKVVIEVITGLVSFIQTAWSNAMTFFGTAAEIATGVVQRAFDGLSGITSTISGWVTEVLGKAGEVASGFITALSPVVGQARDIFNDVSEAILSPIRTLITLIFTYGSDVLNGFLNGITSVWESLTSTADSIRNTIVGAVTGLYDVAVEKGKDFLRGIRDGLSDLPLLGQIVGAVEKIGGFFSNINVPDRSPVDHAGREIGAEFAEHIARGIRSQYRAINLAVDGIGRNLGATALPALTAGASGGAPVALAGRGGTSNTYSLVVNIDGSQDVTAVKRVVMEAFEEVMVGARAASPTLPGNL